MVDVAEIKIWGEWVGAVRWDESQQLGYFQYDTKFIQIRMGFISAQNAHFARHTDL